MRGLLTVKDVADRLGVSDQTVLNLIDRSELAAIRVSARVIRVSEEDLDRFLETRRTASARSEAGLGGAGVPGPEPEGPSERASSDRGDRPEAVAEDGPAEDEPEWDRVLATAVRLQGLLPDATLVGGSAASLYAGHRISLDDDHVLVDLSERFDAVLAELEAATGWKTARLTRPVQILGSLDGVETGVRQLIRTRPLETATVETRHGPIRLPTRSEILRIKAYLIVARNSTRDYLDFAALFDGIPVADALTALGELDALYPQPGGDPGAVRQQLIRQLAAPAPYDLEDLDLSEYRRLADRWAAWDEVVRVCATAARALAEAVATSAPGWRL